MGCRDKHKLQEPARIALRRIVLLASCRTFAFVLTPHQHPLKSEELYRKRIQTKEDSHNHWMAEDHPHLSSELLENEFFVEVKIERDVYL